VSFNGHRSWTEREKERGDDFLVSRSCKWPSGISKTERSLSNE